jgi:MFS family permease
VEYHLHKTFAKLDIADKASLHALSQPVDVTVRQGRPLVPVLGLCMLVGTAAYLMVFTMLGQIGASLHASGPLVNWMVTATIITGTVSAALFPAIGSVIGQRRLMTAALACLALGSLISAIVREHRSGPSLPAAMGVIAAFGRRRPA